MNLLKFLSVSAPSLGLSLSMLPLASAQASATLPAASAIATPDEARSIAKDAFIYAYPMLFNYKTMYEQAIDPNAKAYVGGFGKFRNYSQPYGPENREIVTPNNDTPYSWAWLDLRREPWVLTVPVVPNGRLLRSACLTCWPSNALPVAGVRASLADGFSRLVATVGGSLRSQMALVVIPLASVLW
ncbi:DUF1254 domain-containing protein [Paraburkholderia caffeinilytica]|uniref:DUF1254 domain-containing protein n=1 Tax=Paraburkholderia caffeinilytica TaxID=1761016 RepID=UPI0038BBAC88